MIYNYPYDPALFYLLCVLDYNHSSPFYLLKYGWQSVFGRQSLFGHLLSLKINDCQLFKSRS